MIKLVKGVVNFHKSVLPGLRDRFAKLASGQSPDALMIACSDSRVAPNLFASTDPGDLFVVRNPGNMVPPFHSDTPTQNATSEAAAVEIAVEGLKVKDMIVCGHSRCAGVDSLLNQGAASTHMKQWVRHGEAAKSRLEAGETLDAKLSRQDQASQLNVLCQLENLKTYPQVSEALSKGALRLHGWWFEIATGNVFAYEPEEKQFVLIDEKEGARILRRLQ